MLNPAVGNSVLLPRSAATGFLTATPVSFLRAPDDGGVRLWTVSLAPILAAPTTGKPNVVMRWGHGSATQQATFPYPQVGASFTVAATALELHLVATDLATAVTVANTPRVNGWIVPSQGPGEFGFEQSTGNHGAGAGLYDLLPFARSIVVSGFDAAWTNTLVEFLASDLATVVATVRTNERLARIPVPSMLNGPKGVRVTADAGGHLLTQELFFA